MMPMIYLGAFLFGVSLSVCMPCVIVGTAGSVNAFSSAMAISITMCAQNFAQFLCPYIVGSERRNECKSDLFLPGRRPDGSHGCDRSDLGFEAE